MNETPNGRIKIGVTDIDGILRGKYISQNKLKSAQEKGFGFCNVIFGWDSNDKVYDNSKVSGWQTGYPDAKATLDEQTRRTIPWDNNTPFLLADFEHANEDIAAVCPRTLIKRIHRQAVEMGFEAQFANEYEWFNFQTAPNVAQSPQPITSGMFGYSLVRLAAQSDYVRELWTFLADFGVPLEGLHTETGPGVYEAAIEYADVLKAADRAILFKTSVKEIAQRHHIVPSFMAKWNADLPGCSGHLHQSLWRDGQNVFHAENGLSKTLEYYIAGQLYCLPHILPLYAPTVNSYKRLVAGSWAATSVSWGIENRTTALRVIPGSEKSMRLETRVPGADANPYLAMSAALASGLYGIKHQLLLNIAATSGNAYDSEQLPLPSNLQTATQAMKNSSIPTELFGAGFVDHFVRTREWEWRQYEQQVGNWELGRYFETV
ncbi:MAG: glutamine synthetase family protein [Bacteroidota bacterium]